MGVLFTRNGCLAVLGLTLIFMNGVFADCDESCLDFKDQLADYNQCIQDCSEIPVSNDPPCANDLIACGLGAQPTSADPNAAEAAATQVRGCIFIKYAANTLESQCSNTIQQAGGIDEVKDCLALTTMLCDPTVIEEDPVMCLARVLPDIEDQDATCATMVVNIVGLLADAEEAALEAAAQDGDHGNGKHGGGGGGENDLGLDQEEQVTVGVFLGFTLVVRVVFVCFPIL